MDDTFKSRHSPHADLRVQGQDEARMHNTCTNLAARLDAAIGGSVPNVSDEACNFVGCELPASDGHRGMVFCRGHLFSVIQWAQPEVAA